MKEGRLKLRLHAAKACGIFRLLKKNKYLHAKYLDIKIKKSRGKRG
jgi:hypothetical protein